MAFLCVIALAVLNPLLGVGVGGHAPLRYVGASFVDWGDSIFCSLLAGSGLLLLWHRPRHSVGWILLLAGALEASCTFGVTYGARAATRPDEHLPAGLWALKLLAPLWMWVVFLPVTAMLLRYPSGRIEGRLAARVDRLVIVGLGLLYAGYASGRAPVSDVLVGYETPMQLPGPVTAALVAPGLVLVVGGAVCTVVHTLRRTWRASYPERQQLAWLVTIAPLGVAVLFTPWAGTQKLFWGVPLAVVVGVLRYRLAGIEVVVRRTLLYGALTGLVLLVFVVATAGLSSVMPDGGGPEVLAAAVVAVGVVPLRDRLQRAVDRVVYGDRRDPLSALRRLSTPMGASAGASLLPEVLDGLAAALRVPGAELVGAAGTRATVGMLGDGVHEVPLVMGGEGVGVLRLAARRGETDLPAADRSLLDALTPLLAAVLHAVELADALRVEQERVVAATETERARLRQELHDGLGPSLTGIGLGLEALESKAGSSELVSRLRQETAASLEEVRRIIDGLRPGALERADLLSLLRLRAEHLSSTTPVRVTVQAPARLPGLPSEVEDAALRIVDEALTNVVRHAAATTCTVQVALDDTLRIAVRDDGRGYSGPRPGGVGVSSMESRATGVGGAFHVEGSPSGTVVTVDLPVAVPVASS